MMNANTPSLTAADVAAVTRNDNCNGMFGNGNDWAWIIILLLFSGYNGRGFGGFGGGCGEPCATQSDVRAAVDQQTLISKLDQQTYGLADSTYALNNTLTMDANTATILRRTGAECPTAAYLVQPPTPVNFPTNGCGQVQFGCNGCAC